MSVPTPARRQRPPGRPALALTHLPSSYKVNLYEALARAGTPLTPVFVGDASRIRRGDFCTSPSLDAERLSSGPFETRAVLPSCARLLKLLLQHRPRLVLINGWDLPEFVVALLLSRLLGYRLVLQIESHRPIPSLGIQTARRLPALAALYKRLILRLAHSRLYSSSLSQDFCRSLGAGIHPGDAVIEGVGLTSIERELDALPLAPAEQPQDPKLFAGISRLSPEKNLAVVVAAFEGLAPLHSQHYGGDRDDLEALIGRTLPDASVTVQGYRPNRELPALLHPVNALILVSTDEPWGLVAEEANLLGVPCILSASGGYGAWSREQGLNLVLDTITPASLRAAVQQLVQRPHSVPRGLALQEAVLAKNRRQVAIYADLISRCSPR